MLRLLLQVEAMYKRVRKLKRAADALGPLMDAAEAEREYLEEVEQVNGRCR